MRYPDKQNRSDNLFFRNNQWVKVPKELYKAFDAPLIVEPKEKAGRYPYPQEKYFPAMAHYCSNQIEKKGVSCNWGCGDFYVNSAGSMMKMFFAADLGALWSISPTKGRTAG